jgi:hypothetical protein
LGARNKRSVKDRRDRGDVEEVIGKVWGDSVRV